MKRRILYITGTRADYGLMRDVLRKINSHPGMELHVAVTSMHLMPEFGNTIDDIRQDPFIIHRIEAVHSRDTPESMALFIGDFIRQGVGVVQDIRPDIILLLGDRGEMLGGAIIGAYMGIVVAHVHGGEVTATVDEITRHAITKLSHIHFPATDESAERIIRMGEDPQRVHVVGAPGLDQIHDMEIPNPDEIGRKYHLDLSAPVILVLQHPVTLDGEDPKFQIRETMEAILELNEQTIVIYPNADAGGRSMIHELKKYDRCPKIRMFQNIPHRDFLGLLRASSVLVGNSSSGIIESPSFGIPVVNIGPRQKGRQKGENVIESGYNKGEIMTAIQYALSDPEFKNRARTVKNPYGDGRTSERIVNILESIQITPKLLQKRMMY